MFLSKKSGLTNRQTKEICSKFNCRKNEFAVQKYQDGFLVAVSNKEYRVKFSEGVFSKIVYVKEVQRVQKKVGKK
ncbi:hypothetical protein ACQ1ZE_08605 [Enterococcus faecalis]|uniref:hypothetical protein n=1 Tax=Enterococcus faecalis TaxID=1351 RepID=UPI0003529751|nr:hypothetical protein [Enterococcus faecalis]EPH74748.1 hypothetical protein D929_01090 [Enterococcus faecalis 02-MB-P-10]WBY27548.1 hypothetical protein PE069_05745 [Enterococcus faecalis]WHT29896.1 hypothetical protein OGM83_03575 [Enterococcus faecalis]HCJ0858715.1 hypothetical protein [Enterococcus faecalis]HCJ4774141.1 hypothetical protein [Enterococcus faecalis]